MRRVDAAGHRSAGAATCAIVLRVPVLAALAPPDFRGARWIGPQVELTTSLLDERTTHLLTWIAATDPRGAALATVGSRRDLPGFGVRLRTADGGSLTPSVLSSSRAPARDGHDARERRRRPALRLAGGRRRDGVPSRLAGGFRLPPRPA